MRNTSGANIEQLVAWLRDAYAMETGQVGMLENHANDARRHPEMRARIEQHVQETRKHAALVEACLRQLGDEPSTVKNVMAQAMGTFQGMATGAFKDDEVKNVLWDYASEHFEIACYKALIEAGELTGRDDVVRTCKEILLEEERMARFLELNLPTAVRDNLPEPVSVR